jgi:hypothetical protein
VKLRGLANVMFSGFNFSLGRHSTNRVVCRHASACLDVCLGIKQVLIGYCDHCGHYMPELSRLLCGVLNSTSICLQDACPARKASATRPAVGIWVGRARDMGNGCVWRGEALSVWSSTSCASGGRWWAGVDEGPESVSNRTSVGRVLEPTLPVPDGARVYPGRHVLASAWGYVACDPSCSVL